MSYVQSICFLLIARMAISPCVSGQSRSPHLALTTNRWLGMSENFIIFVVIRFSSSLRDLSSVFSVTYSSHRF